MCPFYYRQTLITLPCTHCELQGVGGLWSVKLEILEVGEVPSGPAAPGSKPHELFELCVRVHMEGVVAHAVADPVQELAEVSLRASQRYLATPPRERENMTPHSPKQAGL